MLALIGDRAVAKRPRHTGRLSGGLCILAFRTAKARFHAAFTVLSLAYQVSWILRLYDVIGS